MSEPTLKKLAPVLIGMTLAIIMMAGLGYLSAKLRNREKATVPTLRVLSPQPGDTVGSPLKVRFASSERIELQPTGWGARSLHLHARINGTEYMPAAADIQAADSVYVWTFTDLPKGQTTVELGWADHLHREIASGKSLPHTFALE